MAYSKHELGYEENRFEIVVSQKFHCSVCFLVLKDPVMCKNEHYYCSCCIKKHLENSSFCPTCRESLTIDKIKPAPRIVNEYISELNIHCDFQPRGCPEMVQVGHLKRHVACCGFSPVQCSNDGCNVLLNARDKLHHEAEVCDFRKLTCHDCSQLKNEVKEGIKNEMNSEITNEVKNEIQVMLENKMKNIVKKEVKDMKVEVMSEIKIMLKNEMKGIKEELKGEIKEVVKNAMRDTMVSKKSLEVETKECEKIAQTSCASNTIFTPARCAGNLLTTSDDPLDVNFRPSSVSSLFTGCHITEQPVLFNLGAAKTTSSNKVYKKALRRNRR